MIPIEPIHIALIGPVAFVIMFVLLIWNRLNIAGKLSLAALMYVLSVLIGALSGAYLNVPNVSSAYVSGMIAPIVLGTILSLILWIGSTKTLSFFRKTPNNQIDNEDEFLDHFDES